MYSNTGVFASLDNLVDFRQAIEWFLKCYSRDYRNNTSIDMQYIMAFINNPTAAENERGKAAFVRLLRDWSKFMEQHFAIIRHVPIALTINSIGMATQLSNAARDYDLISYPIEQVRQLNHIFLYCLLVFLAYMLVLSLCYRGAANANTVGLMAMFSASALVRDVFVNKLTQRQFEAFLSQLDRISHESIFNNVELNDINAALNLLALKKDVLVAQDDVAPLIQSDEQNNIQENSRLNYRRV